jgi:predicted N-acetyltransferase YhbS
MIEIRTATTNDAELIADISRETFYETYVAYNTKEDMDKFMSEQFNKEKLVAQVGTEGNCFLLAYENGEPVGYVFLRDETHPHIPQENAVEICRLYARSSFIGRGVGKALDAGSRCTRTRRKQNIHLAHRLETKRTRHKILHFLRLRNICRTGFYFRK